MPTEQNYSRESFDKADREEQEALHRWGEDILSAPAEQLREDVVLPTEQPYFEAVARKFHLLNEAEEEAHRLQEKHQELINSVERAVASGDTTAIEEARTYLYLFEKNELDLHRNDRARPQR